jgi:hypothetical protein
MWKLREAGVNATPESAKEIAGVLMQAVGDEQKDAAQKRKEGKEPVYRAQVTVDLNVFVRDKVTGKERPDKKRITFNAADALALGVAACINTVAVRQEQLSDAPSLTPEEIRAGAKKVYNGESGITEGFGYGQELGEYLIQQHLPHRMKPATSK